MSRGLFGTKVKSMKPKTGAPPRADLAIATAGYLDGLELEIPDHPLDSEGTPTKPKMPSDITKISMKELGLLYGQFVAIAQYADTQLALVDIQHFEAEYDESIQEALAGLHADGSNKEEREWNRRLNPHVKLRMQDTLVKKAKKVLLTKLIHGYDRAISALSRELSRREWDMDKGRKT